MVRRKKDDGFTLIELMIVIAVIGILAVVLIPKISGIKDQAKLTGVETNVRSVQDYVAGQISTWETNYNTGDAAADTSVQNAITTNFNTKGNADYLTNPLGGTTAIGVASAAIPANGSKAPSGTNGEVLIYVSGFATNGIVIAGIDNNGDIMNEVTVQP